MRKFTTNNELIYQIKQDSDHDFQEFFIFENVSVLSFIVIYDKVY